MAGFGTDGRTNNANENCICHGFQSHSHTPWCATTQMKAIEQYFDVAVFLMLLTDGGTSLWMKS